MEVRERSWVQVIDQSKFRIPEYQRNYSWDSSDRRDFWNTLKSSFNELQPIPEDLGEMTDLAGLYMGGVYLAEPGTESQYEELDIVDGQQRLATFQLLLKALYDYCNSLEQEAQNEGKFELQSDLTDIKTELDSAFSGTDPSVIMNSEDEEFFAALAAYPENWHTKVRDVLVSKLEGVDDNVSGKMRPRVKTIEELIDLIQAPLKTNTDIDLKEQQPFAEDPDEDDNESHLDDYIRFETSHERMFNAYEESYGLIDELHDELTNGELEERANITMNFSSFILHAIVVDRCLITRPNPDLRLDIFQSINDKGRPLHNVDKIRARIKHRLVGEDDSGPMDEWRDTLARLGGDKDDIENMLVYYVAATEDSVDDVSDARSELMNFFDRSVSDDSNVTPRLTKENAADLVTDVSKFSKYYHNLTNASLSNFSREIDDSRRQEVKRIIDRVGHKIGATQWYALAPYIYMKTDEEAPADYDEGDIGDFLYDVFDAIEVVTLRQSISDRSGAAIEGAYVQTVQSFRSRSGDDKFDSAAIVDDLAGEVRDKAPDLFEDGMIYQMVKNRGWTTGSTAQCVLQRTTSRYLEENDIGLSVQDYSDVEVEHILPQSPISNRSNRTQSGNDPGDYAWLEYFFRTADNGDRPPISEAVQQLIDEGVPSLKNGDIDPEELSGDVDEDDIEQIQDEISNRFIDDIGNLLLLVDFDNIDNSNDLMSKKLPVYAKDDYLPVVVNDYFNGGIDSEFANSEHISMEESDFEELGNDDPVWESDAAERVDKSWTYEVMFERKSKLVYNILQYLAFSPRSTDEDGSLSEVRGDEFEGLQDRVDEVVKSDRDRRIGRRAF
nr:DUF262 domain-containing protein [Haloarchaeobius litoreus]